MAEEEQVSEGLVLYNTLTRSKESFEPLRPGHVGMYVCGPTVYDLAHIGNARPVVVFDVLYRLLKSLFASVTYVRNITDLDDKIIDAATKNGEPIAALTERTTRAFHQDMAALGALDPDLEPRATGHIPQMIAMVERLIGSGNAYAAEGHVLFNVPSMKEYGALSRRKREELIAGARVEVAPYKKDPADFVLWKPSAPEQPGWDSPWGRGRPGWHLECSVMSETHLGETFDIHGGGIDLIFPHHENEIAQSRCAHGGAAFARYWVHNGYLMVEAEKMSKSLGNIITVHELLNEFRGEAIRFALLGAHYRQPLDFTRKGLQEAKKTLDRWYRLLDAVGTSQDDMPREVADAIKDDMNTPQAIAELHKFADEAYMADGPRALEAKRKLKAGGGLLGILQQDPEAWFRGGPSASAEAVVTGERIESRVRERDTARNAGDFAKADRIRDELRSKGILLEDGPTGTTWRRES